MECQQCCYGYTYDIKFKIKHKLYIASESAPPKQKFWVCISYRLRSLYYLKQRMTTAVQIQLEVADC
jgi:hypothetical protein